MCLQYKPTVVACFCIHLSCKWSNWEIPLSNEKREWFYYVDKTVTAELLEQVTAEFLVIYEKYPTRLKNRINQGRQSGLANSAFEADMKKGASSLDLKDGGPHPHMKAHHVEPPKPGPSSQDEAHKRPSRPHEQNADQEKLYRQKKERERMVSHQKPPIVNAPSNKHPIMHGSSHHRTSTSADPNKLKPSSANALSSSRPSSSLNHLPTGSSNRPSRDVNNTSSATNNSRITSNEWEHIGPWGDANPTKDARGKDSSSASNISARVDVSKAGDGAPARPSHPADKRPSDSNKPAVAAATASAAAAANRSASSKQFGKLPSSTDGDKRHAYSSAQDNKPSAFLSKPATNATSQRLKSPFGDVPNPKSVPASQSVKADARNGNLSLPSLLDEAAARLAAPPPTSKKPSLFSPEQTTPPKRSKAPKTPPSAGQRLTDTPQLPATVNVPPALSPFPSTPKTNTGRRNRTSSSGSEPELRPVVKKLDQMTGYENILRDSKMGIKLPKVPDIIQPIADLKPDFQRPSLAKELKPPDLITPFNTSVLEKSSSQSIVNGIETNPVMISNLLKETPAVPHLPAAIASFPPQNTVEKTQSEHHHKSEKKKKKEKHKHKDKSKSKEDKEKKKKHKDKDREKHRSKDREEATAPIKITIPKDKITPPEAANPSGPPGLKIKIPRDKLKTDGSGAVGGAGSNDLSSLHSSMSSTSGNSLLKIKISKDQISGFVDGHGSRKREREREKESPGAGAPPAKASKSSSGYGRQNGRSSYAKVSNNNAFRAPPRINYANPPPPPPLPHPLQQTPHSSYYSYRPPPNFPPPSVVVPPPSMQVPPPYFGDPHSQMFSQFYSGGYPMFHHAPPPQELVGLGYQMVGGADAPPLPAGPPPNNPPPPPE